MADYYYQDAQGQLRGPSTLPVILALKESGLLTAETLVRVGLEGVPLKLGDLVALAVAEKAQREPKRLPVAQAALPAADYRGGLARIYFTIAQIYCFLVAIRIIWRMFFATVELSRHSSTIEDWLTIAVMLGFAFFEFCFYGALLFVFSYVKRRWPGKALK